MEVDGLEPTNSEETRFIVWRRCRLAILPVCPQVLMYKQNKGYWFVPMGRASLLTSRWRRREDSNLRPLAYEANELPTALPRYVLWSIQDSNLRPSACKADALPSELIPQDDTEIKVRQPLRSGPTTMCIS